MSSPAVSLPAAGAAPARQAQGLAWVHRVAVAGLAAVLCTIVLGAVVTSLDVGMAYNTWPGYKNLGFFGASLSAILSDGGMGALIEHSHRISAAVSTIVVAATLFATLLVRGTPRSWRLLALALVLLIGIQAYVGGQRVLLNDRSLAMVHGVGAQGVLAVMVALTLLSSPAWRARPRLDAEPGPACDRLRLWSAAAVAVLFVHLFAGAGLRHQQASLSGHVLLAGVATVVLLWNVALAYTRFSGVEPVRRAARRIVQLLGLQLALGLATWAFKYGPAAASASLELHATLSTAHVVVGALLLAVTLSLAMEAWLRLPGRRVAA